MPGIQPLDKISGCADTFTCDPTAFADRRSAPDAKREKPWGCEERRSSRTSCEAWESLRIREMNVGRPLFSIIIPAHNEEKYINRSLASLRTQSTKAQEIIVVADSCLDRTAEIAREEGCRVIEVQYMRPGCSRNAGMREAMGDILVCIDSDVRVTSRYLHQVEMAVRKGYQVGRPKYYVDSGNPLIRHHLFLNNHFRLQYYPHTFFITREALNKVGMFPEEYKNCHEDLAFSDKVRRYYRGCLVASKAFNSDRRFRANGSLRELVFQLANVALFFISDRLFGKKQDIEYKPVR
jgi:glycosyltransferase involved in cell wall biosynthesis